MSRKNRNARRQSGKAMDISVVQASVKKDNPASEAHVIRMVDERCGYEFTRLSSRVLESDTSYQRRIDEKRVTRIVENFDPRVVNPLKVSLRDGHYYVFDGAHTLAALKEINRFDNFMVDCMLFHGLAYEDEAYLFALQRGESKEVAAAARLKALMLSNDARACDLRRRTEEAGFMLSAGHSPANGKLTCAAKLWKIYETSPELYSETLSLLMSAWHGEAWSLDANIIGGMALFIRVYGTELNHARLLKQLCGADIAALNKLRDDNSKNKDYSYAYALLRLYNKNGGKASLAPYCLYEYKV